MAFSKEEAEEIKKQLLEQVEALPNENKLQIKEYIKNLDEAGLEEFLKKNKIQLSPEGEGNKDNTPSECIFCSITKNKIPSYKIAENKKSIAILEINPLSKGHSLVLPLEHLTIDKLPKSSLTLAQKLAKKIKKKLKPEDIKIETSSFQGHATINIIPIYKEPLKKTKASEEELKKLKSQLETKNRSKRKTTSKEKSQEKDVKPSKPLPEIHFRIP